MDILYLIREDKEQDKKILCYNREPIKLYINSYGGSIDDMWGLIDIILASKTQFIHIVLDMRKVQHLTFS